VTGAVRDLARQHTETAITTLVEICEHGENEMARIGAAIALLDRAYGKPTIGVEVRDAEPDIGALILEAHRRATETLAIPIVVESVNLDKVDE
jgi:hypothetical protein